MVPFAHPSPQPKRHLNRWSRVAGLITVTDRQTDWPTDHATRSVTIGRIYVRSTAMRPNNHNDNTMNPLIKKMDGSDCEHHRNF